MSGATCFQGWLEVLSRFCCSDRHRYCLSRQWKMVLLLCIVPRRRCRLSLLQRDDNKRRVTVTRYKNLRLDQLFLSFFSSTTSSSPCPYPACLTSSKKFGRSLSETKSHQKTASLSLAPKALPKSQSPRSLSQESISTAVF
jgi:hypothetical protein